MRRLEQRAPRHAEQRQLGLFPVIEDDDGHADSAERHARDLVRVGCPSKRLGPQEHELIGVPAPGGGDEAVQGLEQGRPGGERQAAVPIHDSAQPEQRTLVGEGRDRPIVDQRHQQMGAVATDVDGRDHLGCGHDVG